MRKMAPAKMNMSNVIPDQRRTRKQKISSCVNLAHRCCTNRRLGRALSIASVVIVLALVVLASSAAFGANPAEEMAKAGATGGIDPKGNSWFSIEKSIEQFAHPSFIFRLFLSFSLAVVFAYAIELYSLGEWLRDGFWDFMYR